MNEAPVTARDIIAAHARTGFPNGERAQGIATDILVALEAQGFVVMAPQDIEWGACPETPGEPHRVSLSLCSGCLQYDPE